ncbi:MAG: HD-GYP domain-containing protein [Sporomusaceae bacterium]|nr:HD-GYP domain-containing protein [Sporomusaceae bacterium]
MEKNYALSAIKPGMILGKDVLTANGKIVLAKHVVLTRLMIERLQEWGCRNVDILEESRPSLETKQQCYMNEHAEIVKSLGDAFKKTRHFKEIPISHMNDITNSTIKKLLSFNSVISFLHLINSKDDYTFRHSLNVAVIAGVVGKWLLFDDVQLRDLVLAGLLHDIGKTRIPLRILNKPGKLTPKEMDIMKQHSRLGYELIVQEKEISTAVKKATLQHHERLDGSGYPNNLFQKDISKIACIIAVADTYDAMTSHRIYRNALTPLLVMEELLQEMFGKLDAEICMLFINNTKEALLGSSVRLSNGTEGKIIFMNRQNTIEPIVQTAEGQCLDLKNQKNVEIIDFIPDSNKGLS